MDGGLQYRYSNNENDENIILAVDHIPVLVKPSVLKFIRHLTYVRAVMLLCNFLPILYQVLPLVIRVVYNFIQVKICNSQLIKSNEKRMLSLYQRECVYIHVYITTVVQMI